MQSWRWWRNGLSAWLAVGTVFQAVAQAVSPPGAAQIVPFRPTGAGSPAAGAAGVTAEKAGGTTERMGVAVERSGDKNSTVWLQFVNTDIAAVARSLGAMTGRQVLVDTQDI